MLPTQQALRGLLSSEALQEQKKAYESLKEIWDKNEIDKKLSFEDFQNGKDRETWIENISFELLDSTDFIRFTPYLSLARTFSSTFPKGVEENQYLHHLDLSHSGFSLADLDNQPWIKHLNYLNLDGVFCERLPQGLEKNSVLETLIITPLDPIHLRVIQEKLPQLKIELKT